MKDESKTYFAPQLYIPQGTMDISFYLKGMGAIELRSWKNDDGSYHVAELSINGAMFHLHEESKQFNMVPPTKHGSGTVMIGLFVPNVNEVVDRAVRGGATIMNAVQDYDYGYRQGEIKDPFGHLWLIEQKI